AGGAVDLVLLLAQLADGPAHLDHPHGTDQGHDQRARDRGEQHRDAEREIELGREVLEARGLVVLDHEDQQQHQHDRAEDQRDPQPGGLAALARLDGRGAGGVRGGLASGAGPGAVRAGPPRGGDAGDGGGGRCPGRGGERGGGAGGDASWQRPRGRRRVSVPRARRGARARGRSLGGGSRHRPDDPWARSWLFSWGRDAVRTTEGPGGAVEPRTTRTGARSASTTGSGKPSRRAMTVSTALRVRAWKG